MIYIYMIYVQFINQLYMINCIYIQFYTCMYVYIYMYKMYMELGQRSPYTFAILHTSHQENLPSWTQAYWW